MTLSPRQFAYDNADVINRAKGLQGANDVRAIFGEHGLVAPAPWARGARRKDRMDYDRDVVTRALTGPPKTEEIDPVNLHATQPKITRGGVQYYMGDQYDRTGRTFADMGNAGNRFPVVYEREDGQNLLLSGHHRATAALLKGQPLRARRTSGPWGAPRRRTT